MKRAHALAISILVVLRLGAATVFQSTPGHRRPLALSDADIAKEQRRLDALHSDIDESCVPRGFDGGGHIEQSEDPTAPAARNDMDEPWWRCSTTTVITMTTISRRSRQPR